MNTSLNKDGYRSKPNNDSNSTSISGLAKLCTSCIIIILLLAISFLNSTYSVSQNEYAYVTRFSKVVNIHSNWGLNFKAPFIDKVRKIPSYKMLYDVPPSEAITSDKKTLVVDNFVIWRVVDPKQFVQTLRGSVSEMEARLDSAVYSAIKNEFGRLNRDEIISVDSSSVERVSMAVTEAVNKDLKSYGVEVTAVEIKKTDLPIDNAEAVYQRMIAERDQIAATYIAEGELEAAKIKNDVDKQVDIIIAEAEAAAAKKQGEADAEYMKILSSAYSSSEKAEFYKFLRSLDALKNSFNPDQTTLILDEDSEIVKIMMGK